MAATRPSLMLPNNETENFMNRITREGKRVSYKLTVMQQPERARACGAGAKSSADRRPVDPPPVVELRILESDPNDDLHKTDVTFAYNANFFLFATLETARPMAPGRGSGSPTCPVLTGVPVAGIAYLDRPAQAGYFIFPDLSVRHEGRYRLNFHLYEEIKEPKDFDKDAPMPPPKTPLSYSNRSKPAPPQSCLQFRLDVRSTTFIVYSAKKFPGLATSTSLSRIIAEQGCRVRIRRDVRMRRRGDKQQSDDYEYDGGRLYRHRSNRFATSDAYTTATPIERPRSSSNGAVELPFAYSVDVKQQQQCSSCPGAGVGPAPEYGYHRQQPYQRLAPPAPASHHPTSFPPHLPVGPLHSTYQSSQPQATTPESVAAPPTAYQSHQSYARVRDESSGPEYEPAASVSYPYQQSHPPPDSSPVYAKTGLPPLLLEPSKPLQFQPFERRSSDPNAYQSVGQSSASRSQTPSSLMPSLPPSLPPIKSISADFGSTSSQSLGSLPQSPSLESTPMKRHIYETGPAVSKRSHAESFGYEDYGVQSGLGLNGGNYPNMRRKFSDAHGDVFFKDPRSEMEYKRADGKVTTKIHPTAR